MEHMADFYLRLAWQTFR